ncbi:MAG: DUF2760 domain-containing protein [Methylococcales bacterium]|jgi:hypothetical protein|nr:DUF2760 domain-containing protein [Methylococcales bacterium]
MNTDLTIDLLLIPSTLDAYHIALASCVLVLAVILVITLLVLTSNLRKQKKIITPTTVVTAPITAAEPQIIEKIIEIEKEVPGPAPEPIILKEFTPDAATQLLSLLQKDARFIDFIFEDIAAYNDQEVGMIARVVHDGCNKVINEHFILAPICPDKENSSITIHHDFDADAFFLTGNITGQAPFTGTLIHKGWQVTEIKLPKISEAHNVSIITPAEVEL